MSDNISIEISRAELWGLIKNILLVSVSEQMNDERMSEWLTNQSKKLKAMQCEYNMTPEFCLLPKKRNDAKYQLATTSSK